MELAHRISCTVESGRLVIDLPPGFSTGDEVEVIILSGKPKFENQTAPETETEMPDWLREIWGGSPDFPDRIPYPSPSPAVAV